jgi:predicted transposase YbfD/YdcC
MESPLKYFAELKDPRVERTREHVLEEIVLIAIAAILSGAGGWNEIKNYGKARIDWLHTFLALPSGIPLARHFQPSVRGAGRAGIGEGFRVLGDFYCPADGGRSGGHRRQGVAGTRKAGYKGIVHLVSAWANTNNLVLAQRKVDDKSNEITAIPKLLAVLELSGTVVTIDAMGCQTAIAEKIVDKKADYILAVKENQPLLLDDIQDSFRMLAADSAAEEIDCGHGRVERRACAVLRDLSLLDKPSRWRGGCAVWCAFRPSDSTRPAAKPNARPATTSAVCRPTLRGSISSSVSTGASKTNSTGCSM